MCDRKIPSQGRAMAALLIAVLLCLAAGRALATPSPGDAFRAISNARAPEADDPSPPASPVRLIFIHHSTGGNWLADPNDDQPYGGLGRALMDNNYYVSATNYGWGPDNIGDRTDIPNWPEWFTGPDSATILAALYGESGQNIGDFGAWPRLATAPAGENQIVMFKSCFPNSDLYGNPDDPPLQEPNDQFTVANAKAVYNKILTYFATRQDKLFIVITAPPLAQGEYLPGDQPPAERAANARAFNNWLVNDWLAGYPYRNVAVFDYYNVLTSNGGNVNTNDAGWETGNHHRWWNNAEQHIRTVDNNYAAYPSGDSHPTTAGHQKATAEFVPLLNIFYNRWRASQAATPTATPTAIRTPTATATATRPADRFTYLPLILKGLATTSPTPTPTTTRTPMPSSTPTRTPSPTRSPTPTSTPTTPASAGRIQPADLVYVGAFRLPGGEDRPQTFAYGGNAMTFNPDGDPANADPYGGSLFIMGHDRLPYGELPDGNQVAEVSIPVPAVADNPAALPEAAFIQGFHNVAAGYFTGLDEIPKVGMQYLNHLDTGARIHLAWGQHLQPPDEPSHAWFNATLASPNLQGVWLVGDYDLYSTTGYLFDIPEAWADAHVQGRLLATGRFRDGGQGGMGPALIAYRPWLPGGVAPPSGTRLTATALLLYENAYNTSEFVRCLNGYQHADEWEGGAWLTTPAGKHAVVFVGTKGAGAKHWYGYINPRGPEYPCVDADVTDFDTCRLANGASCPPEDYAGCCDEAQGTCVSYRGWWSARFDAQIIFYDPADLEQVAAGTMEPWQPQPYAALDIDEHLYLAPPEWDRVAVGWGVQRRYRIGDAAYDRERALLYVLELLADGGKPVVHVWRVQ